MFDLDGQLGGQLTGKPAGQFVGQLIQPDVPDQDPPAPLDDDISEPATSMPMASCRFECGPPLPIRQLYYTNPRARPMCKPCFNAKRAIQILAKTHKRRRLYASSRRQTPPSGKPRCGVVASFAPAPPQPAPRSASAPLTSAEQPSPASSVRSWKRTLRRQAGANWISPVSSADLGQLDCRSALASSTLNKRSTWG